MGDSRDGAIFNKCDLGGIGFSSRLSLENRLFSDKCKKSQQIRANKIKFA